MLEKEQTVQIEDKEKQPTGTENDVLVESILKGQGLTEKEIGRIIKKYHENHRDIVFLTQAMTKKHCANMQ